MMTEKDIVENISTKIRELREKKRSTQEEVAEGAGISTNHYARIERGEVEPGVATFVNVAKSLGVKYEELLP